MAVPRTCYSAQVPRQPLLNFDRVEYGGEPLSLIHCAFCGRGIEQLRFEVFQRAACPVCVVRVTAQLPADDRKTFLRSGGIGLVAAVGASLLYLLLLQALSATATWTVSVFAALGVGWSIGKAMHWAARRAGGRRYQWTGAVLAYAATVLALHVLFMGTQGDPWWSFPFILLQPVGFLFTDLRTIGFLQISAAFVAVRWIWTMLRKPYNPVRELVEHE